MKFIFILYFFSLTILTNAFPVSQDSVNLEARDIGDLFNWIWPNSNQEQNEVSTGGLDIPLPQGEVASPYSLNVSEKQKKDVEQNAPLSEDVIQNKSEAAEHQIDELPLENNEKDETKELEALLSKSSEIISPKNNVEGIDSLSDNDSTQVPEGAKPESLKSVINILKEEMVEGNPEEKEEVMNTVQLLKSSLNNPKRYIRVMLRKALHYVDIGTMGTLGRKKNERCFGEMFSIFPFIFSLFGRAYQRSYAMMPPAVQGYLNFGGNGLSSIIRTLPGGYPTFLRYFGQSPVLETVLADSENKKKVITDDNDDADFSSNMILVNGKKPSKSNPSTNIFLINGDQPSSQTMSKINAGNLSPEELTVLLRNQNSPSTTTDKTINSSLPKNTVFTLDTSNSPNSRLTSPNDTVDIIMTLPGGQTERRTISTSQLPSNFLEMIQTPGNRDLKRSTSIPSSTQYYVVNGSPSDFDEGQLSKIINGSNPNVLSLSRNNFPQFLDSLKEMNPDLSQRIITRYFPSGRFDNNISDEDFTRMIEEIFNSNVNPEFTTRRIQRS